MLLLYRPFYNLAVPSLPLLLLLSLIHLQSLLMICQTVTVTTSATTENWSSNSCLLPFLSAVPGLAGRRQYAPLGEKVSDLSCNRSPLPQSGASIWTRRISSPGKQSIKWFMRRADEHLAAHE